MKQRMLPFQKYVRLGLLLLALATLLPSLSLRAQTGEETFKSLCSTCHKTDWTKAVGPGLAGLKERRKDEWIRKWISDSKALIASGDADAVKLFNENDKLEMPAFPQLDEQKLTDLIAYIEAEGAKAGPKPVASAAATGPGPNVADPVGAMLSDLTTWAAILLVVLCFVAVKVSAYVRAQSEGNGQFEAPFTQRFLGFRFLLIASAAGAIIYLLAGAFKTFDPGIHNVLFAGLPYLAVLTFLVGTVQRYRKRGYTVSSLSSQFLEGKQLFWGSQPFHWGLMFLFAGHLIAFMFPRAVMAWNGMPVRLLILEISSFVFGLSALLGIVLLIYRRFASGKLMAVASTADMLVYVTLLTQIISGLGVAFFVRWGSSWFAGVLTPYLRSLFALNPDIAAVTAMPWVVKLHIVSAFFIIAIIPYTRFMHFLVAPFDYLWRSTQVVIWNYNHREIRNSKRHTFGRKSRNH